LLFTSYKGAISDLTRALEICPNDAIALYFRAIAKENLKYYPEAITDLLKAVEIDPALNVYDNNDDPGSESIHDHLETIVKYTNAIKTNPLDINAYRERAWLKAWADDFYGANADYTIMITIDSCNAEAYFKRGYNKYFHLKDYAGALADFNNAVKFNPEDLEIYLHRASTKGYLNDVEGEMSDFSKIIELFYKKNPNDREDDESSCKWAYNGRAFMKRKLLDFDGAMNDYTEAIKLDPHCFFEYASRGSLKI